MNKKCRVTNRRQQNRQHHDRRGIRPRVYNPHSWRLCSSDYHRTGWRAVVCRGRSRQDRAGHDRRPVQRVFYPHTGRRTVRDRGGLWFTEIHSNKIGRIATTPDHTITATAISANLRYRQRVQLRSELWPGWTGIFGLPNSRATRSETFSPCNRKCCGDLGLSILPVKGRSRAAGPVRCRVRAADADVAVADRYNLQHAARVWELSSCWSQLLDKRAHSVWQIGDSRNRVWM
jgi:hypothetical protein